VFEVDKQRVILIVDDEPFARLLAAQIFLDEGYTVLEAGDALEALVVLDGNDDVSILLTDISMPGSMDGLALVNSVRALRPEIGLVVTSGRIEPPAGAIPDGGRFLPKPYTAQKVLEIIRNMPLAA
jgi:CheY-like chemotaxis protein